MLLKYFVLISVLMTQLSTIYTRQDQESDKTQYEKSLKELETLIRGHPHDNEVDPSHLALNLTEHEIKINVQNPFEKKKSRDARSILIQLRDYAYNAESHCIRNISAMTNSNSTVTPQSTSADTFSSTIFPTTTTRLLKSFAKASMNTTEGKHCIRWKNFFDKCLDRDFLQIKAKIKTSSDRIIFSEQVDLLISVTRQFNFVHLKDRWYKDKDYSKENLIRCLKEHTRFGDNFYRFLDVFYDIVVDFYERWRIPD